MFRYVVLVYSRLKKIAKIMNIQRHNLAVSIPMLIFLTYFSA